MRNDGYFGEFRLFLRAAKNALLAGGHLVFTMEKGEFFGLDYKLNIHDRYSHAMEYVETTVTEAGLRVCDIEEATFRKEAGEPVPGLLVISGHGEAGFLSGYGANPAELSFVCHPHAAKPNKKESVPAAHQPDVVFINWLLVPKGGTLVEKDPPRIVVIEERLRGRPKPDPIIPRIRKHHQVNSRAITFSFDNR